MSSQHMIVVAVAATQNIEQGESARAEGWEMGMVSDQGMVSRKQPLAGGFQRRCSACACFGELGAEVSTCSAGALEMFPLLHRVPTHPLLQ